jgi:hypothetical protein
MLRLAPVCEIEATRLLRSSSSSILTVGMSGFGIEKPVIYRTNRLIPLQPN